MDENRNIEKLKRSIHHKDVALNKINKSVNIYVNRIQKELDKGYNANHAVIEDYLKDIKNILSKYNKK
jgi:hypothetical protein